MSSKNISTDSYFRPAVPLGHTQYTWGKFNRNAAINNNNNNTNTTNSLSTSSSSSDIVIPSVVVTPSNLTIIYGDSEKQKTPILPIQGLKQKTINQHRKSNTTPN